MKKYYVLEEYDEDGVVNYSVFETKRELRAYIMDRSLKFYDIKETYVPSYFTRN